MLIDSVSLASGDESAEKSTYRGKTVVFTSYCHAKGEKNWYPSIFFFDLDRNQLTWQIQGAEIFVNIDKEKNVTILTNEIWGKCTLEMYKKIVNQS